MGLPRVVGLLLGRSPHRTRAGPNTLGWQRANFLDELLDGSQTGLWDIFNDPGNALAAPDTGSNDAIFLVEPFEVMGDLDA